MNSNLLKYQAKLHRLRDRIEKYGVRASYQALKAQYDYVLKEIESAGVNDYVRILDNIPTEPIKNFLRIYYVKFAPIAMMQRDYMMSRANAKKAEPDNVYLSLYERYMYQIIQSESGDKITTITATTKERILSKIREQLQIGEDNGLGIDEIQKNIRNEVGASLKGNAKARAKAIAQTEMIQASNRAQHFAAEQTGLEYRKFWSSSHLPGTRISHQEAEQDSIARGGLRKNELHSNGLLYVGDPNGPAAEVINCRCTELYEIV